MTRRKSVLSKQELAARGLVRVRTPWGDSVVKQANIDAKKPKMRIYLLSGAPAPWDHPGGNFILRQYVGMNAEGYRRWADAMRERELARYA